ncbi:Do family serine endopeptidase [Coraliomargarita parva]|uniref:Do family serine endopeptidase n=1 Tax=Coraliomargarita parva TaxID=3014050 RepID=UPI0022B4557D|nr:Do family serine endopeptidase [Coraliomargarita parva]
MKLSYSLLFVSFFACSLLRAADDTPQFKVEVDTSPVEAEAHGPVVSYADTLERATPSVAAVYTSKYVTVNRGSSQPGIPEILRQFGYPVPQQPSTPNDAEPRQRMERLGVGSGVIVSTDGYIVTNHHVVHDTRGGDVDEIRVRLTDNTEYVAKLVGSDEKTDVAVLKIEPETELPVVTIADSEKLRVGDVVFAIGNPLEVGLTATQGIVSATGRNSLGILGGGGYEDFIQTDAAINLGNSGGALIDARGRLVGINTAIVSRSGGSIGIGFAIPANMVLHVMTNLIQNGEVPRGLLGLYPENLTPDMADAFGLDSTRGALVNQVQDDSPAEKAGIKHGDVIIRVDAIEIESAPQLRLVVSQMLPGSQVKVTLIRKGKEQKLTVTLGSLSGTAAVQDLTDEFLEGVGFESLDDEARSAFSIPDSVDGVLVSSVASDSPYVDNLARGMVILEVNDKKVKTPEDIEARIVTGEANRLYVWYGEVARFIILRVQDRE